MELERLRVNSKRSMNTSVDTDSDCGSEYILLATDITIRTFSKSKSIPAKRQKTRRWCGSAKYSTKYKK